MAERTLGFVGLGHMGQPMAARLVAAGHRVVAFDRAGTRARLPDGATAAESIEDLAARAGTLLLSLPDGAASDAVCAAIVAAPARHATELVDLSTIGIAAARRCAERLAAVGVAYVDAPVSGGVAGARAGTLAVMVGADAARFARLRPL